mmetsp:Transcript_52776/g.122836  ORF Transcript_52776/g.122836 Transcript_52776/m.122836 type:complete len:108 (-) Transcript_52776:307-630(-)
MAIKRCRALLPAAAVILGAGVLVSWTLSDPSFVSPQVSSTGKVSTVPRSAKSLFERTKDLNEKLQEANSENELLIDTDAVWGVAYLVAGILATWFFVSLLAGLKPTD